MILIRNYENNYRHYFTSASALKYCKKYHPRRHRPVKQIYISILLLLSTSL